jgi:DeoR family fructose operon transcriptional repressor
MIIAERQEKLLQVIQKSHFLALADLMTMLNVSASTLRRDLDALEAAGKVHRVHGGVESLLDGTGRARELSIAEKMAENADAKRAIAKRAAQVVRGGDIIFLDAGTTTGEMIPFLAEIKPVITVVTNSVHHAARLSDLMMPVMVIGGMVKQTTDATIGAAAAEQISQLAFDKSFLGTNGVTSEAGFTTPDIEEAAIKRTVIAHSTHPYVLADQSKVGGTAFAKTADLSDATLITDKLPDDSKQTFQSETTVIEAQYKKGGQV